MIRLLVIMLISASAWGGEVYLCQGPDGKKTAQDRPCPTGHKSKAIPTEPPEVTMAREQEQARISLRHQLDAAQQTQGKERQQQRKSYSIPVPVPQPSVITNCDSAGCWDNMGGRYNRGAGDTYFGPSGRFCQMIGDMMQCP